MMQGSSRNKVWSGKCQENRRKDRHAHGALFFIAAFILLCLPPAVHAQYGIKAGITVSNFYYPGGTPQPDKTYDVDLRPFLGYAIGLVQTEPQKPLVGPYISVYRLFGLTKRLWLRPEVSYAQKGVNFSQSGHEKITYKVKINYLEVPLSLNWQYIQKEKNFSDLYLGGYGAFSMNAFSVAAFHDEEAERVKLDAVKNFDWGLHLGLDYKHLVKEGSILVDLRLFLGLGDVLESPDNATKMYFDIHKTKFTGFNVSLGYEL